MKFCMEVDHKHICQFFLKHSSWLKNYEHRDSVKLRFLESIMYLDLESVLVQIMHRNL